MNGARWLAQALVAEGVETLFGYPGGTIMPFYDALHGTPALKHVLVRHEQGAAFAANGYARASGRVGVCVATSGPGASNLVTGIADAMLDSVPMVVLTEIQDGSFARQWIAEYAAGNANYKAMKQADLDHPIEAIGKKLRSNMKWLATAPAPAKPAADAQPQSEAA